jgi:hypothetical protein
MSRFSGRAFDPIPPSVAPASGVRGALDSIVQGALVDLFAAYGVALAPLPRAALDRVPLMAEITAAVGFTHRGAGRSFGQSGRLTLSLPGAVLELMKGNDGTLLKGDWARELANQLAGRIKNRLLPFSVRLELGVSSSTDAHALSRGLRVSSSLRVYAARTLRGEVVLALEGMPDESELVYVGASNAAAEGDAILF